MSKPKLPTIKAIMAENNCTAEAAESIRARLEVEADRAHFRKTGKHLLPVVSARDLERHPELAVQDAIRPKFTEWKIEDYVKKPENRALFIEASLEEAVSENDPGIFSNALVAIVRSMDKKTDKGVAAVLLTVSTGINMTQAMLNKSNLDRCTTVRARKPVKVRATA